MIMVANTAALWIYTVSVLQRFDLLARKEPMAISKDPPDHSVDLIVATAVDDVISALTAGRNTEADQRPSIEAQHALDTICRTVTCTYHS
ncbi:hypothetical protein [Rhodococcus sp. T7]|uniref:hypothetical protein n=1 Tax=Rhodococcus sp. T7 TaxID=627444 RepID=UPI0013575058|nr:hypothetical protein [Rhodococcus sp. T7]KAF0963217.1 hypothetical protein MLGJGCBP_03655 [Rhodococcus sp. T7]